MKKVLSIAGSDPSGGAGIQADIKTITAHKMYAMTAVTALTVQNTTGVFGVFEAPAKFVAKEIDAVMEDIFPDAVKIGMVSDEGIVRTIADRLAFWGAKNIVCDPVMVATSGGRLMSEGAAEALSEALIPLAAVITPNIPEAEVLSGFPVRNRKDMLRAAERIAKRYRGWILVKGGHLPDTADDLLFREGEAVWFEGEKVDNPNTHGTGCTLSSAIACGLADGKTVEESVRAAKAYPTGALRDGLDLGRGSGPLNHCYAL